MKIVSKILIRVLTIVTIFLFGLLAVFQPGNASIAIAAANIGLLIIVIVVYYLQLKAMNGQLEAMQDQIRANQAGVAEQLRAANAQTEVIRHGTDAQNLLALINFLQAENVRSARTIVMEDLDKMDYSNWDYDDKINASRVCSSYTSAGIILTTVDMPKEPILESWGPSIVKCHRILKPHIEEMQKPENGGPKFWADYDWLNQKVIDTFPNIGNYALTEADVSQHSGEKKLVRRKRVAGRKSKA